LDATPNHSPEAAVSDAASIAAVFVKARRSATAMDRFPGRTPASMADAYVVQDEALKLWPAQPRGWKLGRIAPELEQGLGVGRLAGPIFKVWPEAEETVVPVFEGGFAAVEAEYVFQITRDAPASKLDWTLDEAAEMVDRLFVGVEMAGSPLADINSFGPIVVASDFGNNAGLILGPEIKDWRRRPLEGLTCETWIDGVCVGRGGALNIPDGPMDSVRFLLALQAGRGRPLVAGDWVSTGAATGIHDIKPDQSAEVTFGGDGRVRVRTVQATPV
jgi:2-keto-4-pentenoate hydratase